MCEPSFFRRRCVEDYFSSMNPMAKRIVVDTETAKQSYGMKWNSLSHADRCDVVMEAMVKAKVGDKYSYYPQAKPDVESFPKLGIRSGEKYVIDEEHQTKGTGNRWRDEHSGPFSWETRSQLDLHFPERSKEEPPLPKNGPPIERLNGSKFYKVLPKVMPPFQDQSNGLTFQTFRGPATVGDVDDCTANSEDQKLEKVFLQTDKNTTVVQRPSRKKITSSIQVLPPQIISEPKTDVSLLPQLEAVGVQVKEERPVEVIPSNLNVMETSEDLSPSKDSDIPKTGFDFLDDW